MEKRLHPRTPCEMTASLRAVGGVGLTRHSAAVIDISEGGIRLRTDRFIGVQKPLCIEMENPNNQALEAVLRPVWVREIPSIGQYEVGAAFSSISPECQKVIRKFFGAKLISRP